MIDFALHGVFVKETAKMLLWPSGNLSRSIIWDWGWIFFSEVICISSTEKMLCPKINSKQDGVLGVLYLRWQQKSSHVFVAGEGDEF